jgi:hypothetical protein
MILVHIWFILALGSGTPSPARFGPCSSTTSLAVWRCATVRRWRRVDVEIRFDCRYKSDEEVDRCWQMLTGYSGYSSHHMNRFESWRQVFQTSHLFCILLSILKCSASIHLNPLNPQQVYGDFASWLAEACRIGCVIQAIWKHQELQEVIL